MRRSVAYKAFFKNKAGLFGAVIVAFIVIFAVFAPWLAPHDPTRQDVPNRLAQPSIDHPLGTDQYGRDVFSRLIYGARISLVVGILAVLIGLVIGVFLGLVAGYSGGLVDLLICKIIDILMSFPMLLLAMAIVAILGTSLVNSILAVGISSIPRFARLARGQVLALKNTEFIEAGRALGLSPGRIVFFHLFPNILSSIVIMGTLYIATAIIMESNLSFLGLGAQAPTATWGGMISDGRAFLRSSPWVSTFPGIAIALSVLAFNMLGDGLRDALDPKLKMER
ncbi:MAG: ABC transporter permease [Deltaproteobacteria bacterium]|nr:ABC transporter permease [Deltaproteobacteria bacterium]